MSDVEPKLVPTKKKLLSNQMYDVLKFMALVLLPALGTAYFSLAGLWELPNADKVVGTIVVIDTFLGVLLGISNSQYQATEPDGPVGNLVVSETDDRKVMSLDFPGDPNDLENFDKVTFKVRREQ